MERFVLDFGVGVGKSCSRVVAQGMAGSVGGIGEIIEGVK